MTTNFKVVMLRLFLVLFGTAMLGAAILGYKYLDLDPAGPVVFSICGVVVGGFGLATIGSEVG